MVCHLPPELWEMVSEMLARDMYTPAHLNRVSRTLHGASLPVLYGHLVISRISQYHSLLHTTLVLRRHYAQYVRSLHDAIIRDDSPEAHAHAIVQCLMAFENLKSLRMTRCHATVEHLISSTSMRGLDRIEEIRVDGGASGSGLPPFLNVLPSSAKRIHLPVSLLDPHAEPSLETIQLFRTSYTVTLTTLKLSLWLLTTLIGPNGPVFVNLHSLGITHADDTHQLEASWTRTFPNIRKLLVLGCDVSPDVWRDSALWPALESFRFWPRSGDADPEDAVRAVKHLSLSFLRMSSLAPRPHLLERFDAMALKTLLLAIIPDNFQLADAMFRELAGFPHLERFRLMISLDSVNSQEENVSSSSLSQPSGLITPVQVLALLLELPERIRGWPIVPHVIAVTTQKLGLPREVNLTVESGIGRGSRRRLLDQFRSLAPSEPDIETETGAFFAKFIQPILSLGPSPNVNHQLNRCRKVEIWSHPSRDPNWIVRSWSLGTAVFDPAAVEYSRQSVIALSPPWDDDWS